MDFLRIILGDGDGNVIEGQLTLFDGTVVNFIVEGKAKEKSGELKKIQLKSIGGYLIDLFTDFCGASFKFKAKLVAFEKVPPEVLAAIDITP